MKMCEPLGMRRRCWREVVEGARLLLIVAVLGREVVLLSLRDGCVMA